MRNYQTLHAELNWIETQMNGLETYNRRLEICLGSVLILTAALLFSGWRARGRKRTLSPREIQDQTVQAVLSQTA